MVLATAMPALRFVHWHGARVAPARYSGCANYAAFRRGVLEATIVLGIPVRRLVDRHLLLQPRGADVRIFRRDVTNAVVDHWRQHSGAILRRSAAGAIKSARHRSVTASLAAIPERAFGNSLRAERMQTADPFLSFQSSVLTCCSIRLRSSDPFS